MPASEMVTTWPSLNFMDYGMCSDNYIVGVRVWDGILEGLDGA